MKLALSLRHIAAGLVLAANLGRAVAYEAYSVTTFETGRTPTVEIHVATTGSDTAGNGSVGNPYRTIARGVAAATPGAAVRIHPGTYPARVNINDLAGTAQAPIWIGGVPGLARPVIENVSEGLRLKRVRYLIIHDLEVRNAADNAINCDDGNEYTNPEATQHMVFRDLSLHDIGGTGIQNGLKLSGVNDFFVLDCDIARCGGNNSGSGIDLVGCRDGIIANNYLHELSANAVQCKGGTERIEIRANRIADFGQRSVNIGGTTGFAFFRPPLSSTQPNFEARAIRVIGNVIERGVAALAFVGAIDCVAENNTVINPNTWLIRILQETVSSGGYTFVPCGNNRVSGNAFYYDRADLSRHVNTAANTLPTTFTFSHNLWFAHDNPAQSAPVLPVAETSAVIGLDPRFLGAGVGDYRLSAGSPAAGSGRPFTAPAYDFIGFPFRSPPAIGAHELSPWQAWRQTNFSSAAQLTNPAISGPTATPAQDGIANLAKFALGQNPWSPGSAQLPAPALAGGRLTMQCVRAIGADASVRYAAEVSGDLAAWQTGAGYILTSPPVDLGNGTELLTFQDAFTLPPASRRFLRLRFTFLE